MIVPLTLLQKLVELWTVLLERPPVLGVVLVPVPSPVVLQPFVEVRVTLQSADTRNCRVPPTSELPFPSMQPEVRTELTVTAMRLSG